MTSLMKAAVCRQYGPPDVVTIEHVPKPVPGPHDVLIRVRACTVSSADWRIRSQNMPYGFGVAGRLAFGITALRQPILGSELAGDIVEIGAGVRHFAVGDAVVAFSGAKLGAHAAYCCRRADAVMVRKPAALSYETVAALAFGGTTSRHRIVAGPTAERVGDLRTLVDMAVDGRFTPLIDSHSTFDEIVAAHARVETGRKRGSVVVTDLQSQKD